MITDAQSREAIRKHAFSEAINAVCFKCADGEKREYWNGDMTHTADFQHSPNIKMIGHYSCPANPIWRLLNGE